MIFFERWIPAIVFRGISDDLWKLVEPLIPVAERPSGREYLRQPGGGRKSMLPRQVFSAIVYVMRSGSTWKALPKRFGSASTVHRHYQLWESKGFFQALWNAGLAEHAELEGISWNWKIAGKQAAPESRSVGKICNGADGSGKDGCGGATYRQEELAAFSLTARKGER